MEIILLFATLFLSFHCQETQSHNHHPIESYSNELSLQQLDVSFLSRHVMTSDISNFEGKQYSAKVGIGSARVEMSLILDSSSSLLWFPTKDCATCQSGTLRYDTSASNTYRQVSGSVQSFTFDGGELRGYACEEQVWLTDTLKIDKVPCIAVVEQTNLSHLKAEGVLGLSPSSLLDLMKDREIIENRVISFLLKKPGITSTFSFGEPDYSEAPSDSKTARLPMPKEGQVYSVALRSSRIDQTSLISSPHARAVLSSGTGLIGIPSRQYSNLLVFFFDKTVFLSDCGRQKCTPCNRPFHSKLVLGLGSHNFTLPSSKLWRQRANSSYCELLAYEAEGDNWILGTNFLQEYFVVVDYEKEEAGLTGQGICQSEEDEQHEKSEGHAGWIVGGVIVGVIIVGMIIFCCWKKRGGGRREGHQELREERGRKGRGEEEQELSGRYRHDKVE